MSSPSPAPHVFPNVMIWDSQTQAFSPHIPIPQAHLTKSNNCGTHKPRRPLSNPESTIDFVEFIERIEQNLGLDDEGKGMSVLEQSTPSSASPIERADMRFEDRPHEMTSPGQAVLLAKSPKDTLKLVWNQFMGGRGNKGIVTSKEVVLPYGRGGVARSRLVPKLSTGPANIHKTSANLSSSPTAPHQEQSRSLDTMPSVRYDPYYMVRPSESGYFHHICTNPDSLSRSTAQMVQHTQRKRHLPAPSTGAIRHARYFATTSSPSTSSGPTDSKQSACDHNEPMPLGRTNQTLPPESTREPAPPSVTAPGAPRVILHPAQAAMEARIKVLDKGKGREEFGVAQREVLDAAWEGSHSVRSADTDEEESTIGISDLQKFPTPPSYMPLQLNPFAGGGNWVEENHTDSHQLLHLHSDSNLGGTSVQLVLRNDVARTGLQGFSLVSSNPDYESFSKLLPLHHISTGNGPSSASLPSDTRRLDRTALPPPRVPLPEPPASTILPLPSRPLTLLPSTTPSTRLPTSPLLPAQTLPCRGLTNVPKPPRPCNDTTKSWTEPVSFAAAVRGRQPVKPGWFPPRRQHGNIPLLPPLPTVPSELTQLEREWEYLTRERELLEEKLRQLQSLAPSCQYGEAISRHHVVGYGRRDGQPGGMGNWPSGPNSSSR